MLAILAHGAGLQWNALVSSHTALALSKLKHGAQGTTQTEGLEAHSSIRQ